MRHASQWNTSYGLEIFMPELARSHNTELWVSKECGTAASVLDNKEARAVIEERLDEYLSMVKAKIVVGIYGDEPEDAVELHPYKWARRE